MEEWPLGPRRHCNASLKVLSSNPTRCPTSLWGSWWPLGQNCRNTDLHQVSEVVSSTVAQIWLWGSQIAVKKNECSGKTWKIVKWEIRVITHKIYNLQLLKGLNHFLSSYPLPFCWKWSFFWKAPGTILFRIGWICQQSPSSIILHLISCTHFQLVIALVKIKQQIGIIKFDLYLYN